MDDFKPILKRTLTISDFRSIPAGAATMLQHEKPRKQPDGTYRVVYRFSVRSALSAFQEPVTR